MEEVFIAAECVRDVVVGRARGADFPVILWERLTGAKNLRFGRHLVGRGHEGLAVAFGLDPDSAVDARAAFVGVEDVQFAFADAVENAVDHCIFFVVDVSVETFDETIVSELCCPERCGGRASVADALRVEVRPVGEVEDRGIQVFLLL